MKNIFKNTQINKQFLCYLYVVIGLSIGLTFGLFISCIKNRPEKTEEHESGYTYISPLLECVSSKSDSPENIKLEDKIQDAIDLDIKENKIKNASVYFRDLANGPWIGINESEKFTPASLLKVPIMMTYYKLAEQDPKILNKMVLIDSEYKGESLPNIVPHKKVELNKSYSIEELINYMITESDNYAANALLGAIPYDNFHKTYDSLGLDFPTIENPENYMTVKNYASFFRVLYNASYLNKYYSEKSLSILAQSEYKDGLVAGVPANVNVSHKFGERKNNGVNQLHDCGIVYKENKDYLLCIMTRGDNFNNLSNTIKEISNLVYNNVN